MTWLKIFLAAAFLQPPAHAGENQILIRAANSEPIAYQAYLQAYPKILSYSEWWVRQRVTATEQEKLKNLLLQAQHEFLQGGVIAAREKFASLLQLSHSQDWRSAERAVFVYAELRAAQLALDQDSQEQHLLKAARWGQVEMQSNLFPAPLWQKYLHLKKSRLSETQDLDLWFPEAHYLLVDGRPIEILAGVKIEVDQQPHRFTLVYDHAASETRIGTWSELKAWKPSLKPFAQGGCDQPLWLKNPNLPKVRVFFSESCILNWGNFNPTLSLDIQPIASQSTNWVQPENVRPESSSRVSKWVWAVAGAVVVATALALNQDHDKKPEPSTTVGF